MAGKGLSVTVMQYNILAQGLASDGYAQATNKEEAEQMANFLASLIKLKTSSRYNKLKKAVKTATDSQKAAKEQEKIAPQQEKCNLSNVKEMKRTEFALANTNFLEFIQK